MSRAVANQSERWEKMEQVITEESVKPLEIQKRLLMENPTMIICPTSQ